jgi:hypothetical protein
MICCALSKMRGIVSFDALTSLSPAARTAFITLVYQLDIFGHLCRSPLHGRFNSAIVAEMMPRRTSERRLQDALPKS